jgi:hypothetical protein
MPSIPRRIVDNRRIQQTVAVSIAFLDAASGTSKCAAEIVFPHSSILQIKLFR